MKFAYLILMPVAFLFSLTCSRERSSEEKERELRIRQELRLGPAVTEFQGVALTGDGDWVPLSILTKVITDNTTKNPFPKLQVQLNVGLFGGVTLASDSSNYDWGSGELFATFKRSSGVASLELKAIVREGVFENGTLTSAQAGEFVVTKVESLPKNESSVNFLLQTDMGAKGVLSLEASAAKVEAPDDAGVPFLPALEGSVKFSGFFSLAHRAERIWYDPLKGELDIWLEGEAKLSLTRVFAEAPEGATAIVAGGEKVEVANGILSKGAVPVAVVHLERTTETGLSLNMKTEPPTNYVGTYQGEASSYRVVAVWEFSQQFGNNPDAFAFPKFPKYRLNGIVCIQGEPYAYFSAETVAIDYLANKATFEATKTGAIFELSWNKSGSLDDLNVQIKSRTASRSLKNSTMLLSATNEAEKCAP